MTELPDASRQSVIEEAVRQFIDARWQGQEPDIEEFAGQYPGLDREIRQGIRDAQKIDVLFDSLVQADQSDFKGALAENELVGQMIGGFEIVEMIGKGGMGVVYLARDTKLDRSVAIKSMPAKLVGDSITRTRFGREARLLASLSHPNIAVIYDVIEQDEGVAYLILEYIPGETLAERMAREPLKFEEALSISLQVAEAVSAAHKEGVVHRDLKPSNIKITPDGRVKVLDFGLAKPFVGEGRGDEVTVTDPGRIIGTPAYMSPEQARGKETDHRTDIWSFGCIMYQMLTGHLPFEGETATDTLARIIEREPNWDLLPPGIPAEIQRLLHRCLEKDANRRLGDIADATLEMGCALGKSATAPMVSIRAKSRRVVLIIAAVALGVLLSGIALKFTAKRDFRPSSAQTRLIVLPFENRGSAEHEDIAAGITDSITARLTGVPGLAVISRRSARQYQERERGALQMGGESAIDYMLEGTIQSDRPSDSNSPVRITVQLIRTSDGTHIWAQTHDYDGGMNGILQVQSDIAEQVAQALDIKLLEPERRALAAKPTESEEAYWCYLRGNDYFYRGYVESDVKTAIRMYKEAVKLDPTFALAYAWLSRAHSHMYWFLYDHSETCLDKARKAAEEAVRLNPELPEAHLALGHYYYHCLLDYDLALKEFAIVRKAQPNNSDLLSLISAVLRRQGKLTQALVCYRKAYKLDPFSNILAAEIANTCVALADYGEAERYYDRAIWLAPDVFLPYWRKASLCLLWEGRTEKARAVVQEALRAKASTGEEPRILNLLVMFDIYDGHYLEALTRLSSCALETFDTHFYFVPKALLTAQINGLMGNRQLEQANYESARRILEARVKEQPRDGRLRSSLGVAYAGLGRKKDAIREGKLGRARDLARIYVMVGEHDRAIDQLESLLSRTGYMSIPFLGLDPVWSPLCDRPRFQELVQTGQ